MERTWGDEVSVRTDPDEQASDDSPLSPQRARRTASHAFPDHLPDRIRQTLPSLSGVPPPTPPGAQILAAACTLVGRKRCKPDWINQDSYLVKTLAPSMMLAAVFDGHGVHGHSVSAHVRGIFEQGCPSIAAAAEKGQLAETLTQLFLQAHSSLRNQPSIAHQSGTTATVAIIDGEAGAITVAHVGDSTLMVSRGPEVSFQTKDHKVDAVVAREVVARGGDVRSLPGDDQTLRVFSKGQAVPGLAMSRSLGDLEAQALGVSCTPEVRSHCFGPRHILVIASDGVWDHFPPSAAAPQLDRGALAGHSVEQLTQSLVVEARDRWPRVHHDIDDITAVIVRLSPNDGAPEWTVDLQPCRRRQSSVL